MVVNIVDDNGTSKSYVIHFDKGHYIVVDDYTIDKNGTLKGFVGGKMRCIAKSFSYITAIHKDKISSIKYIMAQNRESGIDMYQDEEAYLNMYAIPIGDVHMDSDEK